MEYVEFVAAAQRKQREYIAGERERMATADRLWLNYRNAMGALGLHPLTNLEIADRRRELERMERDVEETYSDNQVMRAAYAMHHAHDFECSENARGWAVIRPINGAARDYLAEPEYDDAREMADRFGHEVAGTADCEYWFDPRDGLEVALAMIEAGLTCRGSDRIQQAA